MIFRCLKIYIGDEQVLSFGDFGDLTCEGIDLLNDPLQHKPPFADMSHIHIGLDKLQNTQTMHN
jgi:hypothetical protein